VKKEGLRDFMLLAEPTTQDSQAMPQIGKEGTGREGGREGKRIYFRK
jgi:hypothetical protein